MIPGAVLAGAMGLARGWWKAGVGALVVAGPLFLLGQCSGAADERAAQKAEKARVLAAAEKLGRAADRLLAARAAAATAILTANRKEVDDVLAKIPDRVPSDRQRVRACLELRRTGQLDPNAAC